MNLGEFHNNNQGLILDGTAIRQGSELIFTFRLVGSLAQIAWPPPNRVPQQRDGLWEQTCFEAFISQSGTKAYGEWNFSPSGDWAAYAFKDYREHQVPSRTFSPAKIRGGRSKDSFRLEAVIPYRDVVTVLGDESPALKISLTAVLEMANGQKTYWALHHAAVKPDFHQAASFVLEVP